MGKLLAFVALIGALYFSFGYNVVTYYTATINERHWELQSAMGDPIFDLQTEKCRHCMPADQQQTYLKKYF